MKTSSLLITIALAFTWAPAFAHDLFSDSPCKGAYEYHFLNRAAAFGDMTGVELLLQGGADPNGRGYEQVTECIPLAGEFMSPLSLAVRNQNVDLVRLLLKWGADPNFLEGESVTPTIIARRDGYTEILKLLIEHDGK